MNPLTRLRDFGQSYWLDNLTRQLILSGELKRRVRDEGLRGITSNPKTFHEAIVHNAEYDSSIEAALAVELPPQDIYGELVVTDVRDACDALRAVYDGAAGADGFVSLEVSPHLAHDAKRSIEEGHRLFREVGRPNCMIKVPGTVAGLTAIEQLLFEGVNVNITLLFSVDSTRARRFAERFPARFFQGYIAEQNLSGVALGLAACGKLPVFATFSAFMSRAYDFVRMAAHSNPEHMVFVGSHCGVSVGEDGPSQMGLEDLAMFRALRRSTVLYPCDAVSAERLTELALATRGIVYLRTTRAKTPILYEYRESFRVGGSKVLTSSAKDEVTIVAAGVTVFEALAAQQTLEERDIWVRVIDAYSVKPLDVGTLEEAARITGKVIVVEDHYLEGGLGDAVDMANLGASVHRMAVYGEPRSGSSLALLDRHRISRYAIVAEVLRLRGASSAAP